VIRIQPDEGIEVSFGAKVPGSPFRVTNVDLDFSYQESFGEGPPEAYERVLFDALQGDATLFIRSDEVEQSWRIVMPLVDAFRHNALPLYFYEAGSWGPIEADALLSHDQHVEHWRTP
jgi:glucose-6-phosphate 1-dehydrogenase